MNHSDHLDTHGRENLTEQSILIGLDNIQAGILSKHRD